MLPYKKSILFLSCISIIILTSFPLVTQIYITYLFHSSIPILLFYTIFFLILFLFKLVLDVIIEKYNVKYYLKLEKTIKETIFEKYKAKISTFLKEKSDILATHMSLYILYVRTKRENVLDVTKIVLVVTIIYFFDSHLFFYILYAIPFFILFWLLSQKLQSSFISEQKTKDFAVVLQEANNLDEQQARKHVHSHLEAMFRKRRHNRSKSIGLKVTMRSFISFFRVAYLAYFGYYAIISYIELTGLIVGLLYITLFIRPMIHLIESSTIYTISKTSKRKIISLMDKVSPNETKL